MPLHLRFRDVELQVAQILTEECTVPVLQGNSLEQHGCHAQALQAAGHLPLLERELNVPGFQLLFLQIVSARRVEVEIKHRPIGVLIVRMVTQRSKYLLDLCLYLLVGSAQDAEQYDATTLRATPRQIVGTEIRVPSKDL